MGYRGKTDEKARARELRAQAWTLQEIATELGVARSSVSRWVRDVVFDPATRRSAVTHRRPRGSDHPLRRRKLAEIARLQQEGIDRIGMLSDRELLVAGLGLYAGDGAKGDREVRFANSSPVLVAAFCAWFRRFFEVDERRLKVRLYLHDGLDLRAALDHWSEVTGVPQERFHGTYRAIPDVGIRHNKHAYGCAHVVYCCTATQRRTLGLMDAVFAVASGAEDLGAQRWLRPDQVAPGAGLEPATS